MTLKFDGWPQRTTGYTFYATSSFMHNFVSIGEFKLELQSGNAIYSGQNQWFFCPACRWNSTDDTEKQFSVANLALAGIPLTNLLGESMPSRHYNMFNLRLCNAANVRYSQFKIGHMHLCGMDYKYFSPHCCEWNSFGCTAAITCGNACHGRHSDSLYSGSEHSQFNSPRLVKREAGFPNQRRALIGSNELWRVNDSPYYRDILFYATSSPVHAFVAISVVCRVWPRNFTDDLEKQQGISFMLLQALCIISQPSVNSNWSYSSERTFCMDITSGITSANMVSGNNSWKFHVDTMMGT